MREYFLDPYPEPVEGTAMSFSLPPHWHSSMSMSNTRFNNRAHVMRPGALCACSHDETTAILRRPDVTKQLHGLAMDIPASTPEQYRAYIKSQISLWRQVIRASGARLIRSPVKGK